ncbi:NO-inducible flavohemoprotein [Pseudomonas sp. GV071]|jgi:nitric oxide dioxygenase|uniref:NO-inducible flavohemoprotein n=1 Tax=Pseudomonas sp. GV071 TaxID=2135754 RepID=UPI000D3B154A|nr:NO-inducible flavohemoprotein [Pseudomonas sp. GV071]PTQ66668.1 nitric oxide dioxygenase [Pseudomonas sp. GV071]
MLSAPQTALIKATVPLLESGGEALTSHFYSTMLRDYPEVRPLFNQTHQASGAQARALANAVLMYAKFIDRLDALGPLVGQIVNKHVALQILPEHYPIVGSCLLQAIREVLGAEVATNEVIDAWGAAYQQLANLLMGIEETMYSEREQADGGWRGGRQFRLASKVVESEEITSFYFVPADGGALMDFEPGQYIGLRIEIDGDDLRRNYSLSAAPNQREYRISVKREKGGRVSGYLHEQLQVGDSLELFPPAGAFTLRASEKPLALITAGVGITPALAMLEQALDTGRDIHFIHCARHGGVHAFQEWLASKAEAHPQLKRFYCYSEPRDEDLHVDSGFLTEERLARWLPQELDLDAYFLGPQPFMAHVNRSLRGLGVPAEQCYYEFFGPAGTLE